jgi:hypothetical protein
MRWRPQDVQILPQRNRTTHWLLLLLHPDGTIDDANNNNMIIEYTSDDLFGDYN